MKFSDILNNLSIEYQHVDNSNNINHKSPEFSNISNDKPYSIDDAVVIGITGSYGKSTLAYLLYIYFKFIKKYRTCLVSSVYLDVPTSGTLNKPIEGIIDTREELNYLIGAAANYQAEVIILEVNETAISRGLYLDFPFDLKILVAFKNKFNEHLLDRKYIDLKKSFFSTNSTLSLLNAESDSLEEFIDVIGENKTYLFGSGYAGMTSYDDIAAEVATHTSLPVDVYPIVKLGNIDKSYLKYSIYGEEQEVMSTLSLDDNLSALVAAAATLRLMQEYDQPSFNTLSKFLRYVPGRKAVYTGKGRTIIVDSGDLKSVKRMIEEINGENLTNAIAVYNSEHAEPFILKQYSDKRLIYSIVGGASWNLLKKSIEISGKENYKDVVGNIEDEGTFGIRKLRVLGGNIFKLLYNLDEFNESVELSDRLATNNRSDFLDFSNDTKFNQQFKNTAIQKLIRYKDIIFSRHPEIYVDFNIHNFWLCATLIKNFCLFESEIFLEISKYFKTLGNDQLSTICLDIENYIINTSKVHKIPSEFLNPLNFRKIYATYFSGIGNGLNIPCRTKYFTADTEAFNDRRDALRKIAEESNEGDLLVISGRGNREMFYISDIGEYIAFDDMTFIINELNK